MPGFASAIQPRVFALALTRTNRIVSFGWEFGKCALAISIARRAIVAATSLATSRLHYASSQSKRLAGTRPAECFLETFSGRMVLHGWFETLWILWFWGTFCFHFFWSRRHNWDNFRCN